MIILATYVFYTLEELKYINFIDDTFIIESIDDDCPKDIRKKIEARRKLIENDDDMFTIDLGK